MTAQTIARKVFSKLSDRQEWEIEKEMKWRDKWLRINPLKAFKGAKNIMEDKENEN